MLWPYQIDDIVLEGTWKIAAGSSETGPITARAQKDISGGEVVCTKDQDTDCEQSWILTIDTQPPGAPQQVCNLKGTLEFNTATLLCRDYLSPTGTVSACPITPSTNFTIHLGKTDLCDVAPATDASLGLSETLESFYDSALTLPQAVFQTGDMVYFALTVTNPAATIDRITFNSIKVDSVSLSAPNVLYEVTTPGDVATFYLHTAKLNVTREIRETMVSPGETGLLTFEFRLLRDVLDSISDSVLNSASAANLQKDVVVQVIIDIWYHGNDNSMKRSISFVPGAPLPAVSHAQIAYYDVGNEDFEEAKAIDNNEGDNAGFSLSSAHTLIVAPVLVFIFAAVALVI